MIPRFKFKIPFLKLAVPFAAILLFLFHFFHIVDFHEGSALDFRFRIRGIQKVDPRILIVAIDDESITALGQWPWPRKIHAAFLDILARYHPQSVFFDFLFTEASGDPLEDEALALAIQKAGNVVLPFFYYPGKTSRAQFLTPVLQKAAPASGYVNMVNDWDGKVRHAQLVREIERENFYPPAVLMTGLEKKGGVESLPVDRWNNLWINFPGPQEAFQIVSFREIVARAGTEQNDYLEKLLSGRFVLVGHMATGTTDLRATPFSGETPGVLIHASLLQTLLSRRFLRGLPAWAHLFFLIALSMTAERIFRKLAPAKGLAALAGFLSFYIFLNMGLFIEAGWILPFYVPLVSMIMTYGMTLFATYTEIRFQREMGERELQMAARIQEQFLPQAPPQSEFFETAFEARFTKRVGGDLYDWVDLGEGSFSFCVGDVSGKGMPAAIYMAKALSDFRSLEKRGREAGSVCENLNNLLLQNPTAGMFLTFLYGAADPIKKTFRFCSAGHEPLLWFRKKLESVEVLNSAKGMPLGLFETSYETAEVSFEEGDLFLFYSDGVRELRNSKKEEWGVEALSKAFREESLALDGEAGKVVARIFEHMGRHQGKTPAHDDCTLLCVHFKAFHGPTL